MTTKQKLEINQIFPLLLINYCNMIISAIMKLDVYFITKKLLTGTSFKLNLKLNERSPSVIYQEKLLCRNKRLYISLTRSEVKTVDMESNKFSFSATVVGSPEEKNAR